MLSALASADLHIWISILVKTATYVATLLAAGSVLAVAALGELGPAGRVSLRRWAAAAAIAAAVLSLLRVPVRASFLIGGSLDGAVDPMLLGMVAESPLGTSVVLRLIGLALVLAVLLPLRASLRIAVAGAVVTCASFALRGHALGQPRLVLGALVTLHILGLAFWIGALAPLVRAARSETPTGAGALAHEFGTKALWVVGGLVVAGAATLALLGAARPAALSTAYGQMFVVKLVLFAGVLALAALNKLRLTPALLSADAGAGVRLRRSVGLESALIGAILATTAALTTVTSPPGDRARSETPPGVRTVASASLSSQGCWQANPNASSHGQDGCASRSDTRYRSVTTVRSH